MKNILIATLILSSTTSALAGKAELLVLSRGLRGPVQVTERIGVRQLQNDVFSALWKSDINVKAQLTRQGQKKAVAVTENIVNVLLPDGRSRLRLNMISNGEVVTINHQDRIAVVSRLIIETDSTNPNVYKNLKEDIFMQDKMKFVDIGHGKMRAEIYINSSNLDEINDALGRMASGILDRTIGENRINTITLSRKSVK